MNNFDEILLNTSKRILKQRDVLCGSVITGSDKMRSGFGNGDCLFFDLKNNVFAVADGSERFPGASREILLRLKEKLNCTRPDSMEGWKDLINNIYSKQKFHHRTTFCCVSISNNNNQIEAVISNGGDSSVTIVDISNGKIVFQTDSNMDFAGRSKQIFDVSCYSFNNENYRIIISTDGIYDLIKFSRNRPGIDLKKIHEKESIDCVCENIHKIILEHGNKFEYDDIGFILIDPFKISYPIDVKVLIGGTTSNDESKFLKNSKKEDSYRWLSHNEWSENIELINNSGILV